MGIKANFNMNDLRRYAYSKSDNFVEASMEAYKRACIKMVERAKQTNTYQDQTHALRSSIGCVLYHNGEEVYNYFGKPGDGRCEEGAQTGLEYARRIAKEKARDKPIVAVVVAGMDYALYVEAKGNDVLTGSTHQFSDDLKEKLANVKKKFSNHIKDKFNI